MRTRLIIAIVLAVIALPFIFFGLIDPLEGGLALIAAIGLGVVVRLLSKEPFPKLTWISMVTAFGIGVLVLVLAIVPTLFAAPEPETGRGPMWVVVIALLWAYRAAVVVAVVGAVYYLVQLIRALRAPHESPKAPAVQ